MDHRTITDADALAIAHKVAEVHRVPCDCVVDPETLKAAVLFFTNVNSWFDGTKRTIWNTVLVSTVLGLLGLIALGVWVRAKM